MSVRLELDDPWEAARVVDALLDQADAVQGHAPLLAARYRCIADALGDALDAAVPIPSGGPGALAAVERVRRVDPDAALRLRVPYRAPGRWRPRVDVRG